MKKYVQRLLLLSAAALLASCGGGNSSTPSSSEPAPSSSTPAPSSSTPASSSEPTPSSSSTSSTPTDDVAPVISGVQAQRYCEAGSSLNLLEGVTAVDNVDGNITANITVSISPERTITNGVVQFAKGDEGFYDVTYSVKDAAGNETKEYTEITVTEALAPKELVKEYNFNRGLEGWAPEIVTPAVGTHGISHGKYVYDVTAGDNVDWHVKHAYYNYPVQAGHKYEVTAKFKSNKAGTVKFNGANKLAKIGDNVMSIAFDAPIDGGKNIELQFGLLGDAFKVEIESIQVKDIQKTIEKITDLKYDENELVTKDWAFNKDQWHCEYAPWGGAAADIAKTADSATVTVTTKGNEADKGKFLIQTKNNLQAGKKYHVSVTFESSVAIEGLRLGYGNWGDGPDFSKLHDEQNIAFEANTPRTFSFDVTPASNVENPFVCLRMGTLPVGATMKATAFSVEADAVINLASSKIAWAWSETAGRNGVVASEGNSITTKTSGEAEDPFKKSTNILLADAKLIGGKTYQISFDVEADKAVEKVRAMAGTKNQWDPNELFDTNETIALTAGEAHHVSAIVTADSDYDGVAIRVKYGAAANETKITVSNLKFELVEFADATPESVLPAAWKFNDTGAVKGYGDSAPGVSASAENVVFTKKGGGSDTWKTKAAVYPGIALEKGKKYHIALDVVASADVSNFECGAGFDDSDDFKAIDHTYGSSLTAGVKKTISYETAALDAAIADTWCVGIMFGAASADTTITASNLVVEEVPDAAQSVDKEFNFLPEDMSVYANTDAGAQADLYVENGELVYDIIKLSHDSDWYNKFTISNVVLEGGAKYYFEIEAKADKALNASLILNKAGAWDPRATQAIEFSTEYKTFTLETDVMTAELKFEVLMQDLHQNLEVDSAKITFKSIKLYSRAVSE